MREGGLEPPQPCGHKALNLARLPSSATRANGDMRDYPFCYSSSSGLVGSSSGVASTGGASKSSMPMGATASAFFFFCSR
jgi:hypothetical protein